MFRIKKCSKCGKLFIPAINHIYKLSVNQKSLYYCSYKCWREDGGDNGKKYYTTRD